MLGMVALIKKFFADPIADMGPLTKNGLNLSNLLKEGSPAYETAKGGENVKFSVACGRFSTNRAFRTTTFSIPKAETVLDDPRNCQPPEGD